MGRYPDWRYPVIAGQRTVKMYPHAHAACARRAQGRQHHRRAASCCRGEGLHVWPPGTGKAACQSSRPRHPQPHPWRELDPLPHVSPPGCARRIPTQLHDDL